MTEFTPWSSLGGGALIGLSAVLLLWLNGKVAGISGILSGSVTASDDRSWQIIFLIGLLIGAALLVFLVPDLPANAIRRDYPLGLVVAAGLLVGFGSRLGSGCTSGHGICGIARLSPRSIVAVAIFAASGAITVFVLRHLLGVGM